jgi:hypothetical protein
MFRSSPGDLAKQSYRMFDSEYMHPHQASWKLDGGERTHDLWDTKLLASGGGGDNAPTELRTQVGYARTLSVTSQTSYSP